MLSENKIPIINLKKINNRIQIVPNKKHGHKKR